MDTLLDPSGPMPPASAATMPEPLFPKRAKPAIAFVDRFGDRDLLAIVELILARMRDNPSYPAPSPSLDVVATAFDAFKAAVLDLDGGRRSTTVRDVARAELVPLLRELAAYVQHASRGDHRVVLASGFPVQRRRGPTRLDPPPVPTDLRLRHGSAKGQVLVACKPMRAAWLYQWRYARVDAPDDWTLLPTSSVAKMTLQGLPRGIELLVQVRAYGKRGTSDWSDAATWMVC